METFIAICVKKSIAYQTGSIYRVREFYNFVTRVPYYKIQRIDANRIDPEYISSKEHFKKHFRKFA